MSTFRASRVAFAACIAAGLAAGCATTSERTASAVSQPSGNIHADAVYMQRVETLARRRGIDVVWIHPPSKRTRAPVR